MKDKKDTTTIDALARGPGRPRMYGSAAERQKAYRARQHESLITHDELTEATKAVIRREIAKSKKAPTIETKDLHRHWAYGAFMLWQRLAIRTDANYEHDHNLLQAMVED